MSSTSNGDFTQLVRDFFFRPSFNICFKRIISPVLLQDAEIGGCVKINILQRKEIERVLRKTSDANKFRRQKMQRPPTQLFLASDLSIFVAAAAKKRSRLFSFSRGFAMGIVVVS